MAEMRESELQFHMEEFRSLQAERSAVLNRGWNLLQYAFIFSFAFYGWILAAGDGVGLDAAAGRFTDRQWNVVVWIPFLMSVVSLIFSYGSIYASSRYRTMSSGWKKCLPSGRWAGNGECETRI